MRLEWLQKCICCLLSCFLCSIQIQSNVMWNTPDTNMPYWRIFKVVICMDVCMLFMALINYCLVCTAFYVSTRWSALSQAPVWRPATFRNWFLPPGCVLLIFHWIIVAVYCHFIRTIHGWSLTLNIGNSGSMINFPLCLNCVFSACDPASFSVCQSCDLLLSWFFFHCKIGVTAYKKSMPESSRVMNIISNSTTMFTPCTAWEFSCVSCHHLLHAPISWKIRVICSIVWHMWVTYLFFFRLKFW